MANFPINPGQAALVADAEANGPANAESFTPPHPNYLICDRTGFRVPVKEGLKEEWNGAMVRKESWEPRHPQDFVRSRAEYQEGSPRPEQADHFSTGQVNYILNSPNPPVLTGESGSSQFILTWTLPPIPASGFAIASYNLYRSVNGGAFSLLTNTTVLTHTDSNSINNIENTYDYRVTSVDVTGTESSVSNTVEFGLAVLEYDFAAGLPAGWSSRNTFTVTAENGGVQNDTFTNPLNNLMSGIMQDDALPISGLTDDVGVAITFQWPSAHTDVDRFGVGLIKDTETQAEQYSLSLVVNRSGTNSDFALSENIGLNVGISNHDNADTGLIISGAEKNLVQHVMAFTIVGTTVTIYYDGVQKDQYSMTSAEDTALSEATQLILMALTGGSNAVADLFRWEKVQVGRSSAIVALL